MSAPDKHMAAHLPDLRAQVRVLIAEESHLAGKHEVRTASLSSEAPLSKTQQVRDFAHATV